MTSLIAVLLGAYQAFGASVLELAVPISIPLGLTVAGIFAHKKSVPIPFWKCFVAYVMIFFWGTNSHTGPPTEGETVFMVVAFATGMVLSFSSIRDGHWATKIMGLIIFIPLVFLVGSRVLYGLRNWSAVVDYWSGP